MGGKRKAKGNAENAKLNREYAMHVRADGKKFTSSKRRTQSKEIIQQEKKEL